MRELRTTLAVITSLALIGGSSIANAHQKVRRYFEVGVASTGFNRTLGTPIWQYPNLEQFVPVLGPFVVLAGFSTAGAFDPAVGEGAGNSLALFPGISGDALIATHFDLIGMSLLGVSPSSVPNSKLNVKLDNVEILVDNFGVTRSQVPCASSTSDPTAITRAGPCTDDITMADWMAASGMASITCRADGSANLDMRVFNMRPHRLYSVWYIQENIAAGPAHLISAFPFGGVPNVLVTNSRGAGKIHRTLGFCPHEVPQALGWVVALRSNGQNHGGVPVPFLNQEDPNSSFEGYEGMIPGTTINVQLNFNINGVPFST